MHNSSTVVKHIPCEACGSSDANTLFTDGHQFCFSQGCGVYINSDSSGSSEGSSDLFPGGFAPLLSRHLSEETLRKYDYRINSPHHFATYVDSKGKAVAQKRRGKDKNFCWIGDPKTALLYGQNLFAGGGKMVVVTEGEIDALSVAQVGGLKWPVVSVKNGAAGAVKDIKAQLEWLSSFERCVFMYDTDEPGQNAALECAELLPPGHAFIAKLPLKDPNAMLQEGREGELISAQWNATPYRPEGIVVGDDLWPLLIEPDPIREANYPYKEVDQILHGLRRGEIVTIAAGAGIGKSTLCREIVYSLLCQEQTIGYIALEESVKKTALSLMSIHVNQPLHLRPMNVDDPRFKEAFEFTQTGNKISYFDHFGSTDSSILINKIRFMANGLGARWIVLDHLSIMASGDDSGEGERVLLDKMMTRLASVCRELNVGLFVVVHLRKHPGAGKAFEEGRQISLADLRGTAGIAQLSDLVIAIERDQQHNGAASVTTLRVLKNRFSGVTGEAGALTYDFKTGRLTDDYNPFEDDAETGESAPQQQDPF